MKIGLIVIGLFVATSSLSGCSKKKIRTSVPSSSRSLDESVRAVAQPLIDDGWAHGMIVGVLQDEKARPSHWQNGQEDRRATMTRSSLLTSSANYCEK